ncbi:TPR domain protein [Minicystis rosea]|nr:TPR domain protein [Minicystis rosea]
MSGERRRYDGRRMIRGALAHRIQIAAFVAAAALAAACAQTPELAQEHMRRGDTALAAGKYPAALAAYGHAREIAPTDPSVQRALMRVRIHLVAENAGRINADGIEDARYEAQLLLDTDKPRAPVYLTALAQVLLRLGDGDGAKLQLAEALKLDPASVLAHTALGTMLMARKETTAQAKAELEQALKTKPDHAPALIALGQLKLAEGDLVGAADRLEAALRAGEDFGVRMALGNVRSQQQRAAEALDHFQRAVQIDPKSADALSALGQALLGAGRADEAERALRAAIQIRPEPTAQTALGFALARQKKLEPALAIFTQMLALDGTAAGALFGAGMVSEDLGQKERAVGYYQRVLALPAGRERQMLADIQRDAQARVAALTPAPSPSASAVAPPPPNKR